jgi:hypothetical protein
MSRRMRAGTRVKAVAATQWPKNQWGMLNFVRRVVVRDDCREEDFAVRRAKCKTHVQAY